MEDPDQQTLMFEYPSTFTPDATGFIRRVVKIEMGARADHWPGERKAITNHERIGKCLEPLTSEPHA